MKKNLIAITALLVTSLASTQLMAYGGGSGGRGGSPSLTKEQLEKHWNGKAGEQSTPIAGIIAHWKADICGTLNGHVSDETKCPIDSPKKSQ
ncbi:hypothetical protein [Vibrio harveyi]|uniref:hypothetical protein n=1 Tax=Vibrio harveyi TaxID=669 RepID=UPI003CFB29A2